MLGFEFPYKRKNESQKEQIRSNKDLIVAEREIKEVLEMIDFSVIEDILEEMRRRSGAVGKSKFVSRESY